MLAGDRWGGGFRRGTHDMAVTGIDVGGDGFYRVGLHEGQVAPVLPSTSTGGVQVGQFTLAQATVGLVALLALIAYFDKKVM